MHDSRIDSMFSSFVHEEDPFEQERLLTEIVSVEALPIIGRVLRQQLGLGLSGSGKGRQTSLAADLHHEIAARIIDRLRRLRAAGADNIGHDIGDFASYVARISRNVCHDFLREKYPTRHSLKSRIRYLLSAKPQFNIRKSENSGLRCGMSEWKEDGCSPVKITDDQLVDKVKQLVNPTVHGNSRMLVDILTTLFVEYGAPIGIDQLVTLVTRVIGSSETVNESLDTALEELHQSIPDQRPLVDQNLQDRELVRSLWNEILKLPIVQRKLILLSNLDVVGEDLWSFFLESGAVVPSNILGALGISHREFMDLWPRIPLNLTELADHLDLSRDQIIRLRFQARERLRRGFLQQRFGENQ